jgi:hypothetical protein
MLAVCIKTNLPITTGFKKLRGEVLILSLSIICSFFCFLIGRKLLAGDNTKLRAQNSKNNNFNINKIERHQCHRY